MEEEKTAWRTLVVNAGEGFMANLSALLPSDDFALEAVENCAAARRALQEKNNYDIVFINAPLQDGSGTEFARECTKESTLAVILFLPQGEADGSLRQSGVYILEKPCGKAAVSAAMYLAASTRQRLLSLAQENRRLNEKLCESRVMNRAKWVLIKCLSMSEAQAHHYIEKQAMNLRCSKREIAERIINTYEG